MFHLQKEVNDLINKKRKYGLLYGKKEMKDFIFDRKCKDLDERIREINKQLMEEIKKELDEKIKEKPIQQEQTITLKRGPKKGIIKGPREGSLANEILKTLMIKKLKTMKDTIKHVKKKKPEYKEENIKQQIIITINRINTKKDSYLGQKYEWIPEKFLVKEGKNNDKK